MAASAEADVTGLDREYREILRLCQHRALSVAEVAGHMNLLLAAAKVLVSDLIDSGYLIYQSPRPAAADPDITHVPVQHCDARDRLSASRSWSGCLNT
jgi:Protein of unknown function (DUF742)